MPNASRKFETPRTRQFRATGLNKGDDRTIGHIEEFGSSVAQVKRTEYGLGWSYTVGVYDTAGKPEIITVGLPEKTALFALNEATRRLRSGVDLTQGRHRDIVGDVECEFRPVDPKWVEQLMGRAIWFYGGTDFPVLQAIYPDLENRFPEEEGFDNTFERPLMQSGAPMRKVEDDFWASTNPKSSLFDWKFPNPPHTGVYMSNAVHTGLEPITYVSHDEEDGAWQFLGDSMIESGGVLVCLHHPIDDDPTLKDLADLPIGWWAERSKPGDRWIRHKQEPRTFSE
jgi:Domain of unknown function (DUF4262)